MISICIGITSFNCLFYLKNNIQSILHNNANIDLYVIVNDNASTDGTRKWLQDDYSNEGVNNVKLFYTINSFNNYAAYGCAQSIQFFLQTPCEYFLHLDPDCEIRSKDALLKAIDQIESKKTLGAIGEKRYSLRYQHPKSRSLKKFDSYIMEEWSKNITGYNWEKSEIENKLTENHPSQFYKIYKELCGNVMLFKRDIIKTIGTIDYLRFQMWRWDSEYSMRCMLFGYDIEEAQVVASGDIKHFGGRSRLVNEEDYFVRLKRDINIDREQFENFRKKYL